MLYRCQIIAILFLGLLSISPAHAQPIDLKQAQRLAIERNLQLQAESFTTRASDAAVQRAYGLYDPRFDAVLAEGETRDPISSSDPSGLPGFVIDAREFGYRRFDFSLTQKIPTGADLILSFDNMRQNSLSRIRPLVDPSYESELRLSLVQPLLKGFGRTVTEQQILFAIKDRELSVQDLRQRAFELIAQVRDTYYEVLRLRADMQYRETSVALAQKILDENRVRVEVGVLPPLDVLEAEVGLKTRERELLNAQRAYKDALDALAVLLFVDEPLEVAAAALEAPALTTDEEAGLRAALTKRPDLLRQQKSIERVGIEAEVARNQLLPRVDLGASYAHKGFGQEYSDDMDLLVKEDLRNWEIGVNFSYPLGNREARNEYQRSRLRQSGEHARLAQLREDARKEIRAAIRLLEVSDKQIETARRGRELAEEKLRILLKRMEVGLATTRDVLEGEEDLALAGTDLTASLADYNRAVTEYLRATGLLLEREGIHFAGPVDANSERPLFDVSTQ